MKREATTTTRVTAASTTIHDWLRGSFVIAWTFLLIVTLAKEGLCQPSDMVSSLVMEHQKSHEMVQLTIGKTVKYKTVESSGFVKASITGITDSTISLESEKLGIVTIRLRDLDALKIIRSSGRRAAAGALICIGSAGVIAGVLGLASSNSADSDNMEGMKAIAFGIPGAVALFGGIALISSKEIYLKKSWRIVREGSKKPTP